MIDEPRFFSHVMLLDDSADTCWVWVGAMRDDGRGRFWQDGREIRAHWAGWEIRTGEPVPKDYRLEHECSHPQCVRHWKLGRKRLKLTPAAVKEILSGILGPTSAAKKYGVTPQHVCWVRRTYLNAYTISGRV